MAVLSDVHARQIEDKHGVRTWARTDRVAAAENPLQGLANYVREAGIRADVLLCPGDLCDQADWSALDYAWERLNEVAAALGGAEIVATVGNHDVDSHGVHGGADVVEHPRTKLAGYPTASNARCQEYWQSRVTVVRGAEWQVVVLNSTGMRRLEDGEQDTGAIDTAALAAITKVTKDTSFSINVLLCHHHPVKWPRLNPADDSEMERGSELAQILDDAEQAWIVVHGHRHQPHLEYLSGGGDATVRLACGSVGARLSGELSSHVRNQIHIIEFRVDQSDRVGGMLPGVVLSHTWRPETDWELAGPTDGLPAVCGFGFRRAPQLLAQQLVAEATGSNRPALERADMVALEPGLPYLLPRDMIKLTERLRIEHQCKLSHGDDGQLDRLRLPVL